MMEIRTPNLVKLISRLGGEGWDHGNFVMFKATPALQRTGCPLDELCFTQKKKKKKKLEWCENILKNKRNVSNAMEIGYPRTFQNHGGPEMGARGECSGC